VRGGWGGGGRGGGPPWFALVRHRVTKKEKTKLGKKKEKKTGGEIGEQKHTFPCDHAHEQIDRAHEPNGLVTRYRGVAC
jgi:hypothetical protein